MNIFFDSSALVKRYLQEPGSEDVEKLCRQADQIIVSIICLPEIISALNRRKREKVLFEEQYQLIKQRVLAEFQDFLSYPLTAQVILSAVDVLERFSLRSMDAIHVACALEVSSQMFVTADERQLAAVKRLNIKSRKV